MRRAARHIVALVVIGTAVFFGTQPVRAVESFGIGAIPANPQPDNPRTKSIFVYDTPAGKVVNDGVRVINNSQSTRTMKVYAVDSEQSSDGAFACAQAAQTPKDVGSWIKLQKTEVTLDPGKSEVVPFTLTTPPNVDVGEHDGCIAIEESKPPAQSSNNGIVLSFRSALRVAAIVPGDISAKLQFIEVKDNMIQNKLVLSPVLKNTGNISVDAGIHVGLVNVFGQQVSGDEGQFAVLTKNESRFNFETTPPFWGGWYKLQSSADYQPLRQSLAKNTPKATVEGPSRWLYVAPHPLALLIYAVVIVGLVVGSAWWVIRRRTWRFMHQHATMYVIEEGDNLQTLAASHKVNWKILAKLNKLRPPYALKPGQHLKIPDPKKSVPPKQRTTKG